MYELNQCRSFSYALNSGPHTWVEGLLLATHDAWCRGGAAEQARYEDAVKVAMAVHGVDAPCHMVDPDTFSELSDLHKDVHGVRYRGDYSRAEAVQYIDHLCAQLDAQVEDERLSELAAAQRSFGDPQPTAMALAFAAAA